MSPDIFYERRGTGFYSLGNTQGQTINVFDSEDLALAETMQTIETRVRGR